MVYSDLMTRLTEGGLVILDGAIGTEIKRRAGATQGSDLSIARMIESPDLVRQVHSDYIGAGAHVITTNSYGCSRAHQGQADLGENPMERAVRLAVEQANAARDASGSDDVVVAGSLGPLGGDYDPDAVPDYESCLTSYRRQVSVMADSGVDLVLVETASRVHAAKAGAVAAVEAGLPVWTGLVGSPAGTVASGESWTEAVDVLASSGASAVLVNCTSPEAITAGMAELGRQQAVPVGAYGQASAFMGRGWEFGPAMTPEDYLEHAKRWVDHGARIVGGCCATTPEHIIRLSENLRIPQRP